MKKKNNKLVGILMGPALIFVGILALWENEGRFNYYEAALETYPITSPTEHIGETISYTSKLDTSIPITGEYVTQFVSYHRVDRYAQIYSWREDTDSEGNTTWDLGWYSSLENNYRNDGLRQSLTDAELYPPHYLLGELIISPDRIHFVDDDVSIPVSHLTLSTDGRSRGLVRQGDYLYLRKGRSNGLGDERVSYTGIPNADTASYFGELSDNRGIGRQFDIETSFISEMIGNDGILHHLVNGERQEALEKIEAYFNMVVWLTRIGGSLAILIGLLIFFSTFTSLLYRIPLLGPLVKVGVFLVSLVLATIISLLVIIAGMIAHNDIALVLFIVAVVACVIYFVRRTSKIRKNANRLLNEKVEQYQRTSSLQGDSESLAMNASETGSFESAKTGLMEQTLRHLAAVALAEGGMANKEKKILIKWGKRNGLSKQRMKEVLSADESGQNGSQTAKQDDLELLLLMAFADGAVSKPEFKQILKFAEKAGLSAVDVTGMMWRMESGK